jgi:pimeloyl-ACP methyl ester carboxylesterase
MADVSSVAAMTVVLVHGGFVDGSGWEGVYQLLRQDGYRVRIVQHPTISLTDDVAATTRMVHAQHGPVLLVGHSYGGVVITAAGHDAQVGVPGAVSGKCTVNALAQYNTFWLWHLLLRRV